MAELHTPYGRCLEDFQVGDRIHHWPGRTITSMAGILQARTTGWTRR